MIFYLFRHGETYFSKNHLRYGDQVESAEILPEGIPQIIKIAQKLKENSINQIYSSPLKRCVQTVDIIKKEIPGIKVVFDKRIEEEKISRYLETFKDQTQRIKNFLDEVKTKKYQKVGICSHGWPIAVMIRLLKEKKVYTFNLLNYPKCGEIITIETK